MSRCCGASTQDEVLAIDSGDGRAPGKIEKLAGARMTQRNWNTPHGIRERMKDR